VRDKLLRFVGVWLAGPCHCVRRFGRPSLSAISGWRRCTQTPAGAHRHDETIEV
jgi:hypothetical protein